MVRATAKASPSSPAMPMSVSQALSMPPTSAQLLSSPFSAQSVLLQTLPRNCLLETFPPTAQISSLETNFAVKRLS